MIKAILWDFDGTMADTKSVIVNSWKYIYKEIKGIDITEEELEDSFGEPLVTSLEKRFPEMDIDEALDVYRRYQRENIEKEFTIFPNVLKLLKFIESEGIKLGVVTSRGSNSTSQGLDENGIKEMFSVIITADAVDEHKPSPKPIEKALELLDVKPSEAIMIGDTLFDLMASKAAGVKSGLVAWSEVDLNELDNIYKPDFIIDDVEGLKAILIAG